MLKYFTSESVTEGHPDKICDIVSDSVLDAILSEDKNARVACETVANGNFTYIFGDISTSADIDIEAVARNAVKNIGYDSDELGFNADTMKVLLGIKKQSADIALGVDNSKEFKEGGDVYDKIGAGDQGMVFGYACRETEELMPVAITFAHKLCKRLSEVRKTGVLPYLRPDGKAQVTVKYDGGKFVGIDTIVLSTQHEDGISYDRLKKDIENEVIAAVI
ncbi:MAG: methionine adenosyltransferase, partial [Clostridia bacterium]|nr:methionine adenosyltransferase [Clostridia bacterium]